MMTKLGGDIIRVYDPLPGEMIGWVIEHVLKDRLDGFVFNGVFVRVREDSTEQSLYAEYREKLG